MKTIYKNKQGLELTCRMCGKNFKHLGSHIFHQHGLMAREYKSEFGLPYNMGLISVEIYETKSARFEEDREKYVKNLLKNGKSKQFKKGQANFGRRMSEWERARQIKQIEAVNAGREGKMEPCPVCKMTFKSMQSHLYNKHGLLISK